MKTVEYNQAKQLVARPQFRIRKVGAKKGKGSYTRKVKFKGAYAQ